MLLYTCTDLAAGVSNLPSKTKVSNQSECSHLLHGGYGPRNADKNDTQGRDSTEFHPPTLPEQNSFPTNQTVFFTEAEKRAGVPFLHHKMLQCDHHRQEHTILDHDITLRIPDGAVPVGKEIQFEIAVAMYGPFEFKENTQPISPILWLCFEEGVTLNKPFQVILPHFLTGLTKEKAQHHQIIFAKAPHSEYSIVTNRRKYSFQPCDTAPYFASCGGRNFGVLVTNHSCFYCLLANKTPELAKDAGYCLARIDSFNQRHSEIIFTAVYCLPTCLRVCLHCNAALNIIIFFRLLRSSFQVKKGTGLMITRASNSKRTQILILGWLQLVNVISLLLH